MVAAKEGRDRSGLRGAWTVTARELSIPGAWELVPTLHGDPRGLFFEWFTDKGFAEFAADAKANCPVSNALAAVPITLTVN